MSGLRAEPVRAPNLTEGAGDFNADRKGGPPASHCVTSCVPLAPSRTGGYGLPAAARSAASTVFDSSIAIVIGPTPPGTGVIAPATCDDAGEVDVAAQLAGARRGSCRRRSRSRPA